MMDRAARPQFLIWGYTTIAVTIAVYTTFTITQRYHPAMELWLALPIIGGILTWLHLRKSSRPVTTQLDKAVWAVWIAFSAAAFACMAVGFTPGKLWPNHPPFPIVFVIGLMISMATASTGLILKFRPAAVAGFVGIALALLTWIFNHMEQLLIFAGLILVVQVIPGHLLNAACKREGREVAKNGRVE